MGMLVLHRQVAWVELEISKVPLPEFLELVAVGCGTKCGVGPPQSDGCTSWFPAAPVTIVVRYLGSV